MCGRFTLTVDQEEIIETFPEIKISVWRGSRYNIAPGQDVATVLNDGKKELKYVRWGLIPSWAKDISIGERMINARVETLAEKPSFRKPLQKKRCIILGDGFFEWQKSGGRKTPFYFRLKSKKPFAFAGLYDVWNSSESTTITSCTIITTQPNDLVKKVHNRMPVILKKSNIDLWLSNEENLEKLKSVLLPYPADEMECYKVSSIVNNPQIDSPECVKKLTD